MRSKNKTKRKSNLDTATPDDPDQTASQSTSKAGGAGVHANVDIPVDELTAVRNELADVKDKLVRALAEQQNIRKRCANEQVESIRYANTALIKPLLDVLDDFERTMQQENTSDSAAILQGIKLVHQNMVKLLKDNAVERIDPLGQPFDPRFHEAMMQQPTADAEPGTVLQALQPGYIMNDRVLRPAKVIVATEIQNTDAAK